MEERQETWSRYLNKIYVLSILLFHQGILSYVNGDKYDGQWKEDVKDGQGILIKYMLYFLFSLIYSLI